MGLDPTKNRKNLPSYLALDVYIYTYLFLDS